MKDTEHQSLPCTQEYTHLHTHTLSQCIHAYTHDCTSYTHTHPKREPIFTEALDGNLSSSLPAPLCHDYNSRDKPGNIIDSIVPASKQSSQIITHGILLDYKDLLLSLGNSSPFSTLLHLEWFNFL